MSYGTQQLAGTPGFLTNRELDRLGNRRTRERWQAKGLLGEPRWARADRRKLALYPELVLARFVIGVNGEPEEEGVLARVRARVDELAGSTAFAAITDAVSLVLRHEPTFDLRALTTAVAETATLAFAEYHGLLLEATERLADDGVVVAPEWGRVLSVGSAGCLLALGDGERSFPLGDAVSELFAGEEVVVDHVGVLGRERDFLMPAVAATEATREGGAMSELDWSEVTDSDWDAVFVSARARSVTESDDDYWLANDEPAPTTAAVTLDDLRARRAATV